MRSKLLVVILVLIMVVASGCFGNKVVETKEETMEQHIKIDFPDESEEDDTKASDASDAKDKSEDESEEESKDSDVKDKTKIPGLEDSIFDEDSEDYAGLQEPEGPQSGNRPSGGQQGGTGNSGQQGGSTQRPSDSSGNGSGNNSESEKPSESEKETNPSGGGSEDGTMDYESFQAMSPKDQQEYMATFDDVDAFFDWYNGAKEKHEAENPPIEIDGGSVNLDEIINGK